MEPVAIWPVALWAAGFVIYALVFLLTHPLRLSAFPFLFAPDAVAAVWVDNDWSRFAPWDHLPVLAGAAAILVGCSVTGWVVLGMLGLNSSLTGLERFVFGTAVGLNVWSLFTLAAGLAGWLREKWVFATAAAIVLAAAVWQARGTGRHSEQAGGGSPQPQDARATHRTSDWLHKLALGLSVPFAVLIVWGGTLPPTYFDVREYHLQVPKEWYQQGRVTFLPHNVYGNMPLGAEMHAILGMLLASGPRDWWWGSLIGKTIIAAMGPLGAAGIYALGRRFCCPTSGAVAALLYISTPWTAHVSMNGLIDGSSALYLLLALYAAMMRAPENARDRQWVFLCGFLAGAGVACKYPAVLFLVIPLFVWVSWLQFRRVDVGAAVVYTLAVLAGCGLWFGKNWVQAGNPTYPLLYGLFDGKSWNSEQNARWTTAHGPPGGIISAYSLDHAVATAKVLLLTSDSLSPALWPFAVLALSAASCRKWLLLWGGLMLWTVATWWLFTHRIDRFLVPLLPLVALFGGIGASWRQSALWVRLAATILVCCAAFTFVFDAIGLVSDGRLFVSLAELQRDIHPAHHYVNEHVKPGHRALMVGEAQVWDIAVPVLYNTCFDDCNLELLLKGKTRDERLRALREQRISHIYFSWYELDRYRSPGNYGYSGFPTRELVREELAGEQALLNLVPLDLDRDSGELYEVAGWEK